MIYFAILRLVTGKLVITYNMPLFVIRTMHLPKLDFWLLLNSEKIIEIETISLG